MIVQIDENTFEITVSEMLHAREQPIFRTYKLGLSDESFEFMLKRHRIEFVRHGDTYSVSKNDLKKLVAQVLLISRHLGEELMNVRKDKDFLIEEVKRGMYGSDDTRIDDPDHREYSRLVQLHIKKSGKPNISKIARIKGETWYRTREKLKHYSLIARSGEP